MSIRMRLLRKICAANGHNQQAKPFTDGNGQSWMICSMCETTWPIKLSKEEK